MNHFSDKVNLIWDIADTLRGPYRPPEYRKVMLPMTVLRRLDCVLAPTKPQVLATQKKWSNKAADALLRKAACQSFYNTSKLDFDKLRGAPDNIAQDLLRYIRSFSPNVRAISASMTRSPSSIKPTASSSSFPNSPPSIYTPTPSPTTTWGSSSRNSSASSTKSPTKRPATTSLPAKSSNSWSTSSLTPTTVPSPKKASSAPSTTPRAAPAACSRLPLSAYSNSTQTRNWCSLARITTPTPTPSAAPTCSSNPNPGDPLNLDKDVNLKYYRLQKISEGRIVLEAGIGGSLAAPSEVGTGRNEDAPVPLSQVVQLLNDRFGTNFTATDELFWEQIRDDALANQNLQQAGAANTRDDFAYALYQHLEELVVNRMDRNGGQAGMFFENPEVRSVIQNWMLDQVYDRIRSNPR